MVEVKAHFLNQGVPLSAPTDLPLVDIWSLNPTVLQTSLQTMTEVASGSGWYQTTFATTPTLDYVALADGDPQLTGQLITSERYAKGSFKGLVIDNIENQIPQILTEINSLPTVIDSLLSGAHGGASWAGTDPNTIATYVDSVLSAAHGPGAWDAAGGTDPNTIATYVDSILSGNHGSGAWDGITDVGSIAFAVDAVLSIAHGGGSWLTATGFAVAGDSMNLTGTAIDSLATAVNSELSGIHGGGNWEGIASGINSIVFAVWEENPALHGAGTAGGALSRIDSATGATLPTQIGSLDTRVASLATCCASVFTGVTSVTAAIAALNDLSVTEVQSAMTAQGYTTARAALLDNLNVAISDVTSLIAEQPTAVSSTIFGNIVDATGASTPFSFFDVQRAVLAMAAGTIVRSMNVYGMFMQDGVTQLFQLRDDDMTGRSRLVPNSYAV